MKKLNKIGMVIAMRKEVAPMLERIANIQKEEKIGAYNVWIYEVGDKQIFMVESGIGEIFAAGATELLIVKYGVEAVINFGVCGSLTEGLGLLNTVVVSGVVHYDFDTSPIDGCEVGRYMQFPTVTIPCDEEMLSLATSLNPQLKTVICASADKFVADQAIKENLHKTYGASICEMESAGVLLTCINNSVPALIIKAVSDGKGGAEDFKKMVFRASEEYIDLVLKLIAKI